MITTTVFRWGIEIVTSNGYRVAFSTHCKLPSGYAYDWIDGPHKTFTVVWFSLYWNW